MTWYLYFWTPHASGAIPFTSLHEAAVAATTWAKEARALGYAFEFEIV